jgi:hypothetical protein
VFGALQCLARPPPVRYGCQSTLLVAAWAVLHSTVQFIHTRQHVASCATTLTCQWVLIVVGVYRPCFVLCRSVYADLWEGQLSSHHDRGEQLGKDYLFNLQVLTHSSLGTRGT